MTSNIIILCLICTNAVAARTLIPYKKPQPSYPMLQDSENLSTSVEIMQDQLMDLKNMDDKDSDEVGYGIEKSLMTSGGKKPCAMVVLSNSQNPFMQSLMRKYRYDARGILIPSSVQYFMKLRDSLPAAPHMVQLNDKAFSPLGGFVRYYKEVPPIPQSL